MNSIDNLIGELKIPNSYFVPNIIKEINMFVMYKLEKINRTYSNDFDKYKLLSNLVCFGLELENIVSNTNNNIISIQLNFLTGLFKPIIDKIKNICLEINFELVNMYKNQIYNLIETNSNKYKTHIKNIKFLQINCFCKNTNYSVSKEVMFEDFGITIKITNCHYKNIFNDLIKETICESTSE